MTSITVTATPTGASGATLRVLVLTGATASGGASVHPTGNTGGSFSFTPTFSNSFIAWSNNNVGSTGAFTSIANNTILDNIASTGGQRMATGYYTGTVTAGTPVTVGATGASSPTVTSAYEIPASGGSTPAIDASSPAVVDETSGSAALTTASFSPPGSAVVVAIVTGAAFPSAWTVTDSSSMTWTKRVDNTDGQQIWTATTASGGGTVTGSGGVTIPKPSLSGFGAMISAGALLTNSFEGGTSGSTITAAGSGGTSGNALDNVAISTGATATWDNTHAAHGLLSAKFTTGTTSGTSLIEWVASEGAQDTIFFRVYAYFPVAASPAARFAYVRSGSAHAASVLVNGTTLQLSYSAAFNGTTAFTTPIPLAQWFRIEGFFTGDPVNGVVSASLFTSLDATTAVETHTYTGLNTVGPLTQYWFGQGNTSASSGPFWMDDVGISPTGYLGPVGGSGGVLLTSSAEGVSSGTLVTAANSGAAGNPFDAVNTGTGAALSYDNTHAAHGTQSYKVLVGSTSGNSIIEWTNSLTAPTVFLTKAWFRIYAYLTAYSATQLRVVSARGGVTYRGGPAFNSTGNVVLLSSTGSTIKTSTTTVPLNQWFRLEGYVLGDPSVGQLEAKLFTSSMDALTPVETVTTAATVNTGGTINRFDFGNPSSATNYTLWMDDLGVSTTGYIGPAGTPLIPSLFPAFLF